MGKSSEEIYAAAVDNGSERLSKPALGVVISSFIAGLYVAFGGVASLEVTAIVMKASGDHDLAWLVGSMVYPIAFIFVVIGKSELFTENFLTPVLAVWEDRGRFYRLLRLWWLALLLNLLGVVTITVIMGQTEFVTTGGHAEDQIVREFIWVATHAIEEPFWPFLWKAIFAGFLINFMSWLVIASRGTLAKLIMIWIPGFLIMLMGTHHSIVGTTEVLLGIFLGAKVSYLAWLVEFFLPAALGNALGGIVFVAALHYLQSIPTRADVDTRTTGTPTVFSRLDSQ